MDNTEKAKVISKKIFDTAMDRSGTLLDNKAPVYRRPRWKVYFCRNAVANVPNRSKIVPFTVYLEHTAADV